MADSMGLSDATRDAVADSVSDGRDAWAAASACSVSLVALITATSYSRALERMYAKVWQVRRPGLHAAWRWLATVLAVILAVGLLGLTREATEGVPLPALLGLRPAHGRLDGRVDVRAVGAPARRDPRARARVHRRRHGRSLSAS